MQSLFTTFAQAEESGIGALGLDLKAMVFQALTFVILFVLIRKYALEKITSALAERHDTIERGLQDARDAKLASEEAMAKQEQILQTARKESDKIITKAHEEAGSLVKDAETRAGMKADKILIDAKSQIESELVRAREDLKKEMINLVADATGAVLDEKVDPKKDEQLIKSALSGVKK